MADVLFQGPLRAITFLKSLEAHSPLHSSCSATYLFYFTQTCPALLPSGPLHMLFLPSGTLFPQILTGPAPSLHLGACSHASSWYMSQVHVTVPGTRHAFKNKIH